jgi:hypothetical protein
MNSYNSLNEIQNDKIKTALIKVETLQKEYEVTLQRYQESVKNYISSLQSDNTTFTALKGRSWWGSTGLSEASVSSQQECEDMCATNDKCSGATFNPVKKYCWTRTGDSSITVGTNDDYALILQQKQALSVMKQMNEKLLNINKEITDELTSIRPQVEEQYKEKNTKQQQLNESYQKLLEQKIEMDKQLREYYSIEQDETNQSLYVNQQNISMRFWVLITCLILLFTTKRMIGSSYLPLSMTIWLLIIIVLIILTYSLSTPSGFILWFLLILGIILMKTGNLPSP